jgi:hypothetical protein
VDDNLPQLAELGILTLNDASQGRIDKASAKVMITVPSNDNANGVFGWSAASLRLNAYEQQQQAVLTITRQQGQLLALTYNFHNK